MQREAVASENLKIDNQAWPVQRASIANINWLQLIKENAS